MPNHMTVLVIIYDYLYILGFVATAWQLRHLRDGYGLKWENLMTMLTLATVTPIVATASHPKLSTPFQIGHPFWGVNSLALLGALNLVLCFAYMILYPLALSYLPSWRHQQQKHQLLQHQLELVERNNQPIDDAWLRDQDANMRTIAATTSSPKQHRPTVSLGGRAHFRPLGYTRNRSASAIEQQVDALARKLQIDSLFHYRTLLDDFRCSWGNHSLSLSPSPF